MFVANSSLFQPFVCAAAVCLWGTALMKADVIQLLTPADLSPGHKSAAFPEPEGTLLPSPYTLTTSDNTFTYTLLPGGEFLRGNIGSVTFLYNGAAITGVASPLNISVAVPLEEIGVGMLSNTPGNTTFSFTAFDHSVALGTFTVGGPFGTSLFAGVRATSGDAITRLAISSSTNDFVACNCGYMDAVPEPMTGGLFCIGIGFGMVGLTWKRRRKFRRA